LLLLLLLLFSELFGFVEQTSLIVCIVTMTPKTLLLGSLACLFFPCAVQSAPLEDIIENLPGYGRPPTTQFSGFLDATDGCDTSANGPYCKIHYWLNLAEVEDPLQAPVVLWMNGGPGSSSILGLLQENGPLLMNATGGLMNNPWAWTKLANLLVIEAPIGVGYSYCANQKLEGKTCKNTDRFTASASRAALVDFFTSKFPEFSKNEFYIIGESYAGVYIPTLTKEILDHASSVINLKGIAVGDPCTVRVCVCFRPKEVYKAITRVSLLFAFCFVSYCAHCSLFRTIRLNLIRWIRCGMPTSTDWWTMRFMTCCGTIARHGLPTI
jgi:hypothetical protein